MMGPQSTTRASSQKTGEDVRCVYPCVYLVFVCSSEDNFQESVLTFDLVEEAGSFLFLWLL